MTLEPGRSDELLQDFWTASRLGGWRIDTLEPVRKRLLELGAADPPSSRTPVGDVTLISVR